ncbi:MAG: hypothetical protein ABSG51_01680 [Terracidiphilus sp.]
MSNLFAFKYLVKKEGGVGYLFWSSAAHFGVQLVGDGPFMTSIVRFLAEMICKSGGGFDRGFGDALRKKWDKMQRDKILDANLDENRWGTVLSKGVYVDAGFRHCQRNRQSGRQSRFLLGGDLSRKPRTYTLRCSTSALAIGHHSRNAPAQYSFFPYLSNRVPEMHGDPRGKDPSLYPYLVVSFEYEGFCVAALVFCGE